MAEFETLPLDTRAILDRLRPIAHRPLLFGAPGSGKSALAAALAEASGWPCLSGDPGSPAFALPGALALARRRAGAWHTCATEALCSLDAARFRLPLLLAAARLTDRVGAGPLLVDGPGLVRGVAAAELLAALPHHLDIDAVLVLAGARAIPLAAELRALALPVWHIEPHPYAHRPPRRTRDRRRGSRGRSWSTPPTSPTAPTTAVCWSSWRTPPGCCSARRRSCRPTATRRCGPAI